MQEGRKLCTRCEVASHSALRLHAGLAAELRYPRLPMAEELPEPLGLGGDNRGVGQLDLATALVRLFEHQLTDGDQPLLHSEDLGVDLPQVERLLDRRFVRRTVAIYWVPPIAAAHRRIDTWPVAVGLDLFIPQYYGRLA